VRNGVAGLLVRIGLRDTFAPGDNPFVGGGPHAHAYLVVDGRPVDFTDLNPTIAGAAGSLVSTPADLDKFIVALFDGRLVKPAQLAEMTRSLPFTQGFGLGVASSATSCGVTTWGHGGHMQGFTGEATSTLDSTRRLEVYATPVASNDTAVQAPPHLDRQGLLPLTLSAREWLTWHFWRT
jgi:D-alanyl-D-alanine carboxypeptidase